MIRIIGRDVFEGKYSAEHEVIIHDLGHGQQEASISRKVWWEHTATMSDAAYAMYLHMRRTFVLARRAARSALSLIHI